MPRHGSSRPFCANHLNNADENEVFPIELRFKTLENAYSKGRMVLNFLQVLVQR